MTAAANDARLTKDVFLAALDCERRAWLLHHADRRGHEPGLAERFQRTQGNLVGRVAHELLGPGFDMSGPATPAWIDEGRRVLAHPPADTLFEVPIATAQATARPDVLQRAGDAWRLIEVKSGKSAKPEYVDDVAYTLAVAQAAGVNVDGVALALINADWRAGGTAPPLVESDVTDAARAGGGVRPAARTGVRRRQRRAGAGGGAQVRLQALRLPA